MKQAPPAWLKPATDYGPLAAFFIAYYMSDLLDATAVLMVATLLALVVSYAWERRVPVMPLVTAAIVGVFGALTLILQDETFIKMKPTIIQGIFCVVLLGGLAMGRPLLKPLMGAAWSMDDAGWRKLTFRFALFFAVMAVLNEIVWRTQSTDFWVNFKVFGIMGLTILFMLSQIWMIQRHTLPEDGEASEDGPASG